jgi:riboflavin-specific deaminase-like protein
LHRLRALVDAVIVGAGTVENDDPQLTTRLVSGNNPVRVVLDPRLRLSPTRRLFEPSDVVTIVVCARGAQKPARLGHVGIIEIDEVAGVLPPRAIVAALAERGLTRLLIEGGGVTVSRFLRAGVLDRLQVAICPLFIGAGRPGVVLPAIDGLDCALRPATRRFDLGSDVLFDCRLERRM